MKKVLMIVCFFLVNVGLFANENFKGKEVLNDDFFGCCTATAYHYGSYYGSSTACGSGSGLNYCAKAYWDLKSKYPEIPMQAPADPNNPQGLPTLMADGSVVYPDGTIVYPEGGPWEVPSGPFLPIEP